MQPVLYTNKFIALSIFCWYFVKASHKWQTKKDCLQSIPRDPNDKEMAAMLDELTTEANEKSFVNYNMAAPAK